MIEKNAKTLVPVHELIATRWSPRAFDSGRYLTRNQILSLVEAARWAPSCFGEEPWRFLVFDRAANVSAWRRALETLSEKNQRWARNAPLLIVAVAKETFTHNDKPNRWAQYDTGAAMLSLVLQANALGLSAHQMGGFDAERVKQQFGVPAGFVPMAFVAVGHVGSLSDLEKEFHAGESAPRARDPLAENVFEGEWANGLVAS